jgi:four helix bundle protein
MAFDHEKLDVYRLALDFLLEADGVLEQLPKGRGHIVDQLNRASISIVLNIAEGAGKYSGPDKRRYYLSALGSTTESAAIFDILLRLKLTDDDTYRGAKELLERIAAMLVKLAKRHERG